MLTAAVARFSDDCVDHPVHLLGLLGAEYQLVSRFCPAVTSLVCEEGCY